MHAQASAGRTHSGFDIMGVTIRDVAEHAKVSISTVSRVLNDTCKVKEDKRLRVLSAARELGYTPNPAAQSLHSRKTGAIGILLPYVSGDFYAELLNGIDSAAQEEGHMLLISTSHNSEEELAAALQGMYRRVDGILVMAPVLTSNQVLASAPSGLPVVFLNTRTEGSKIPLISFDNYGGMRQMTEYLIGQGHNRIGFITGSAAAFDAAERFRGYREAIQLAGLPVDEDLVVQGEFTQQAGFEGARRLLSLSEPPTAIMASNDVAAIGALSAIRESGLRVPEDVALTGFDDIPNSSFTFPPLTTVHIPISELGKRSVRLLSSAIAAHGTSDRILSEKLPVELRLRASA